VSLEGRSRTAVGTATRTTQARAARGLHNSSFCQGRQPNRNAERQRDIHGAPTRGPIATLAKRTD